MPTSDSQVRPSVFEEGHFLWNFQRVPRTLPGRKTPHPGKTHATFVVYGMGDQAAAATAATLVGGRKCGSGC